MFSTTKERRLSTVPWIIRCLVLVLLATQMTFSLSLPPPTAIARDLPTPPSRPALRFAALGEPVGLAVALTLYLQAFDTQPGVSIPFSQLDYGRLVAWLDTLLGLDPASAYPVMLAAQVYSQVPDEPKQRVALRFVLDKFNEDPIRRWRWLAHAAIVARHRLHDTQLALTFADAIATRANDESVPSWARQMHIFILDDMGEREAAKILLGGLLESGTIKDPHEVRFLLERLEGMKNGEISTPSTNR